MKRRTPEGPACVSERTWLARNMICISGPREIGDEYVIPVDSGGVGIPAEHVRDHEYDPCLLRSRASDSCYYICFLQPTACIAKPARAGMKHSDVVEAELATRALPRSIVTQLSSHPLNET